MSTGLIDIIKNVAVNAVEQTKPVQIRFGTVSKINPVEVLVDSNLTLKESSGQLTLTRSVYNQLQLGDKVVMLRKEGGQTFVVLDRLVSN